MSLGTRWISLKLLLSIGSLAILLGIDPSAHLYAQKNSPSEVGLFLPIVMQDYVVPRIAFLSDRSGVNQVYVMTLAGTDLVQVTHDEVSKVDITWLPGHKQLAYCDIPNLFSCTLYRINPDGSDKRLVVSSIGSGFAWSPSGNYVAYFRGRNLPTLTIMTYPALQDANHISAIRSFAWQPGSERIAVANFYSTPPGIWSLDVSGTNPITLTQGSGNTLDWSADGAKLAFTANDGEIYRVNADGTQLTRLTDTPSAESDPHWSPDGTKILFVAERDGNEEIYHMNADGSIQTRLTMTPERDYRPRWSSDGAKIIFISTRDGNKEIYQMQPDGSAQINLTNHPAADDQFE